MSLLAKLAGVEVKAGRDIPELGHAWFGDIAELQAEDNQEIAEFLEEMKRQQGEYD